MGVRQVTEAAVRAFLTAPAHRRDTLHSGNSSYGYISATSREATDADAARLVVLDKKLYILSVTKMSTKYIA